VELIYEQGIQDSLSVSYVVDTLPPITLDSLSDIMVQLYAGEHDVRWIITDCAGHTAECTTHVTVMDMNLPEISCPDDISVLLEPDEGCQAEITLYRPETSDTCGVNAESLAYRITGDTIINTTFFGGEDSLVLFLAVGDYTIEYSVADLSGNTASCSFAIQIHDAIAPEAACQSGTAFVHPSGEIPFIVDPQLINGGSTDNCAIDTLIVIPGIFPCDSAGTEQLVELIVMDASGNADTCIAALQIEVQELEPSYTIGICAVDTLHLFANVPPSLNVDYTFEWSGPNGFVSSLENPEIPDVDESHAGIYTVIVTGAGGCTSTGSIEVVYDGTNAPFLSVESSIVCEDESVVLLAEVYGQPVTYRWYRGTPPGGLLLGSTSLPVFGDLPPLPGE
jgi:hypothetical protein